MICVYDGMSCVEFLEVRKLGRKEEGKSREEEGACCRFLFKFLSPVLATYFCEFLGYFES